MAKLPTRHISPPHLDIQPEMYDACHDARQAGHTIANLNSFANDPQSMTASQSACLRANAARTHTLQSTAA